MPAGPVLVLWALLVCAARGAAAWNMSGPHPCTVERVPWDALARRFGPPGRLPPLHAAPVVIPAADAARNAVMRNLTAPDALAAFFGPNFAVTLSSSNALSEHRRTEPLAAYLDRTVREAETPRDRRANESWYLFGETHGPAWRRLLGHYELPPGAACADSDRDHSGRVALSFGVGNAGSGVQWHTHGPGFSETLHGRKHWVLYPPSRRPPPAFHKDESSRQWMERQYDRARPRPLECTLYPGDLLYFPDRFWHATINLDPYTSFVSTFTQEHQLAVAAADEL